MVRVPFCGLSGGADEGQRRVDRAGQVGRRDELVAQPSRRCGPQNGSGKPFACSRSLFFATLSSVARGKSST